jgi:hypothetical protein
MSSLRPTLTLWLLLAISGKVTGVVLLEFNSVLRDLLTMTKAREPKQSLQISCAVRLTSQRELAAERFAVRGRSALDCSIRIAQRCNGLD